MQRYSNQAHDWEDLRRVVHRLEAPQVREPEAPAVAGRHKLDQRLTAVIRAELVAAYEAGAPSTQLMVDFGLGKGSVLQVLHEAGVRMRGQSLSPADLPHAVELYQSGLSLKAVGEQVGVSVDAVRNAFVRHGVPIRYRRGWDYSG